MKRLLTIVPIVLGALYFGSLAPAAADVLLSDTTTCGGNCEGITYDLEAKATANPLTELFALKITGENANVGQPGGDTIGGRTGINAIAFNLVSNQQNIANPGSGTMVATLINNVRAGVTRFLGGNAIDGNPHDPRLTDLSYGFVPGNPFGQIIVNGVSSGTSTGVLNGLMSSGENFFGYTSPQVFDDVSWTRGRHTIKMGANFEHIMYNINEPNKPNGGWIFSTISDFITGNLSSQGTNFTADFPGTDTFRSERNSIFGVYIQDDFRMRPNLTINLGLRYEMATMVDEVHNRIANLRNLTCKATSALSRAKRRHRSACSRKYDWSSNVRTTMEGGSTGSQSPVLATVLTGMLQRYIKNFPRAVQNRTGNAKSMGVVTATVVVIAHAEIVPR